DVFQNAWPSLTNQRAAAAAAAKAATGVPSAPIPANTTASQWEQEGGSPAAVGVEDPKVHEHVSPHVKDSLRHGSVVIAAITSCTITSNPSVMIAAGLLAKKAV